VLVTGESGTGKELVARALHRRSRRSAGPFVAVNCAAVPADLLESELYGHARGAFTGAVGSRKGLFLEAEGGVLFLDEVTELPLALQPKLLRALEEQRVRPVGSNAEVPFDAWIIAATNRDVTAEVEEGRFRRDLFYRLDVVTLELPPLRARGADVLLLAEHFVADFARKRGRAAPKLSRPVAEKLLAYPWPGNVRELRNAVERAVALGRYDQLVVDDLPPSVRMHRASALVLGGTDPNDLLPLAEVERRYIEHVLRAAGGNRTLAARLLQIDRKTLYRKLRESEAEPA
jgi:two-component system response regulator HydG